MSGDLTARSGLSRVFLSPGEARLRAGWRLFGHTLLLGLSITLVSAGLVGVLAFTGVIDLDNLDRAALSLSALVGLPAITLATWVARRLLDRRSFRSLGFETGPHWVRDLLVGFAIPIPLFGLIFLFEWAMGWLVPQGWGWEGRGFASIIGELLLLLLAFVAVGYYEELLFRGYYLQNLKDGISTPVAVLASAAAFGFAHLGNLHASLTSTLGIFAAGLFLSYAWLRTRALWLPIGLHIGWNFLEGPVFGFEVSGNPTPRLILHHVNGPQLVTGGAFGPEAGLVVLPAMAIGAVLIWWYTRNRLPLTSPHTATGSASK